MKILVNTIVETSISTISEMIIDGFKFCYVLQDPRRKVKIQNITGIPKGTYKVVLSYSNRFKKIMPEILNVPGFTGIRIHWGNTAVDTEGCLIVGSTMGKDFVGNSVKTYAKMMALLKATKEEVIITID